MLKKALINSIIIFLLSILFHNFYNSLPCFLTSIVAPVNESIFEHLKMIFSSYIFFILIHYLFSKKKDKTFIFNYTIASLFNIVIFLIIYLPIYKLFGESLIVTLIIYFITIFITNYLVLKYKKKTIDKKTFIIAFIIIIISYTIFTILTYCPIKNELFYDPINKNYGISKLNNRIS